MPVKPSELLRTFEKYDWANLGPLSVDTETVTCARRVGMIG